MTKIHLKRQKSQWLKNIETQEVKDDKSPERLVVIGAIMLVATLVWFFVKWFIIW